MLEPDRGYTDVLTVIYNYRLFITLNFENLWILYYILVSVQYTFFISKSSIFSVADILREHTIRPITKP